MEEISSHHNKEKELKVDVYRFYGKNGMQTIDPMRMQAKHSDYMVAPSGLGLHLYRRENSGWRYFYVGDKLIKVEDLIADCAWFKRRVPVITFLYLFLPCKERPRTHRRIRDHLSLKAMGWGPPHQDQEKMSH
jgi:hypothetical protein